MPETTQNKGLLRRFLDTPPDNVGKTVFVAVALCLVASMIVSAAAVALRPIQEANSQRDKRMNILEVAGVYERQTCRFTSVFGALWKRRGAGGG